MASNPEQDELMETRTSMNKKKTVLLLLSLFITLTVASFASAIPPLPTEFYGAIYTQNQPANVGGTIEVELLNGTQCGTDFTIQNEGYFGLITCPGDDPETPEVEGFSDGTEVRIIYNGEQTKVIEGNNQTAAGEFHFLNVSHPLPFCGDQICDQFWEDTLSCPVDCETDVPGNGSNGTGGDGNETEGDPEGGGESAPSTPSSSGGGGGGGGGGAAGLLPSLEGLDFVEGLPFTGGSSCNENWVCAEWTQCQIDGLQTRECTDTSECGTAENKPPVAKECNYVPSCFNGIQDFEETGLDCGGPCQPCATCTNGIQDCHTLENGTVLCETGIDCGGACRDCNSCFNGVQDFTETGVDCGGQYCPSCAQRPILEFPQLICEKSINPFTNAGSLFLILLLLLISIRSYFYLKRLKKIHSDNKLDEFKRSRDYLAERRSMILFVVIALAIALLAYFYYYEFLLCELNYGYLWWFVVLLILVPFLIYELWRFLEYQDKEKLRLLGAMSYDHAASMERMLDVENQQIIELENEVKEIIETISKNKELHKHLLDFPELKAIYEESIELYYEYQKNKSPYGIEKDLCEQVYAIETNDKFKDLAGKYSDFWILYERLKLLYQHYEGKQAVYDEIAQERERIAEHAAQDKIPQKDDSNDADNSGDSQEDASSEDVKGDEKK